MLCYLHGNWWIRICCSHWHHIEQYSEPHILLFKATESSKYMHRQNIWNVTILFKCGFLYSASINYLEYLCYIIPLPHAYEITVTAKYIFCMDKIFPIHLVLSLILSMAWLSECHTLSLNLSLTRPLIIMKGLWIKNGIYLSAIMLSWPTVPQIVLSLSQFGHSIFTCLKVNGMIQ